MSVLLFLIPVAAERMVTGQPGPARVRNVLGHVPFLLGCVVPSFLLFLRVGPFLAAVAPKGRQALAISPFLKLATFVALPLRESLAGPFLYPSDPFDARVAAPNIPWPHDV